MAELFEARRPKDACEIARIDGIVEIGGTVRGKRKVIIKDVETGSEEEHLIPLNKHVIVFKGDFVKKGQQLTDGPVVPHEILDVCGPQELQEHLVGEVQEVYRLQGVEINDKHIEIIVRQMLRKVKITDPGDTALLWGDQVDKLEFERENIAVIEKGGKPAEASPVLLGITKASLETDSFISAASFQDTTRVLTEAATLGKIDHLRGFKENVIMGHLIPAGTGFKTHRNINIVQLGEPVGAPSASRSPSPSLDNRLSGLPGAVLSAAPGHARLCPAFRSMSISTKTGDDGTSGLLFNRRVSKTDAHFEACGSVDELNAALGMARAARRSRPVERRNSADSERAGHSHGGTGPPGRGPAQVRAGRRANTSPPTAVDRLTALVHEGENARSLSTTGPCPAARPWAPRSILPAPSAAGPSGASSRCASSQPRSTRKSSGTSIACPTSAASGRAWLKRRNRQSKPRISSIPRLSKFMQFPLQSPPS